MALETLLLCGGDIKTLFIGNWEVEPIAFPLDEAEESAAALEATAAEGTALPLRGPAGPLGELVVMAQPLYLSEVTTSARNPNKPVKVCSFVANLLKPS